MLSIPAWVENWWIDIFDIDRPHNDGGDAGGSGDAGGTGDEGGNSDDEGRDGNDRPQASTSDLPVIGQGPSPMGIGGAPPGGAQDSGIGLLATAIPIAVLEPIPFGKAALLAGAVGLTIYTGGVILPVIAGFYRNRLRVTSLGALASLIGGGSVGLASKLFDINGLDLGALLISGILLFVVSFIDNKRQKKAGHAPLT